MRSERNQVPINKWWPISWPFSCTGGHKRKVKLWTTYNWFNLPESLNRFLSQSIHHRIRGRGWLVLSTPPHPHYYHLNRQSSCAWMRRVLWWYSLLFVSRINSLTDFRAIFHPYRYRISRRNKRTERLLRQQLKTEEGTLIRLIREQH